LYFKHYCFQIKIKNEAVPSDILPYFSFGATVS
jgi:hypothetical protein